ncbi:threonine--tRNA ligase [Candidatus Vesicomyidisocius calyptogenae]|uniref:Threonine--tRNA ligase n=1 Tax=Vesicomyosocius okutanii subsp. Calyptogena okutanii (strain HA) TaxID=412965 RepID=SYT_VESOH|nr:threonine--tRNA ligase [Candidatus Vesicomyosocius okutanii]A5CWF9.1 RecName: Full=Threonine--tRNA ligase; AltName: Full=Threonyl-tRNA synthetase; Short=ThrRS [Candidatus Vesicomyosocius okutanii]BAF61710.1 threonyl-tRNA synthetase [Candidatus Vesicomyosocius okutanii]
MPIITLPDGTKKIFEQVVSVEQVAKSMGLVKAALAGEVDGELVSTSFLIKTDANLTIITANDDQGLEIIRHSTAHLLAQATQMLYPDAQVTIGPVIDNGFYYDFAYKNGFLEGDLIKIEKNMHKLVKQNLKIEKFEMSRDETLQFFKDKGEYYKVKIIESISTDQILSLYKQGDFIDLCRGPHVPSTAKLKNFKLMKLAGAYWRGDSSNEMLQRVYGTAWGNEQDLKVYLHKLEEVARRDHRKIGKTQDLFHIQEETPGMVFWHAKGWILYQLVEQYMRGIFRDNGYQEVHTPQLIDKSLWEKSGHWDKFGDVMFTTTSGDRDYAVKPMNCPAHIQIYNQGLKSYRNLPLRLAEFGSCHRNEPSGTLHGIMRVRNFVQDDGHIFCTPEQIQDEVSTFIDLTFNVYKYFGFEKINIKLSTRPKKRVGSDEVWDKSEIALVEALNAKNIVWELQEGEGAFYGPKIEFILKDCLDRQWQCGTLQVDFSMPKRLGAQFIDENSVKKTPVILHRAIMGSLERFLGILIEHYEGAYPCWLSPIQAVIINISEKHAKFIVDIVKKLKKQGLRVISDLRNEKVSFKIREHSLQRYPYILVVGDREMEKGQVSVRQRGGKDLGAMSVGTFIKKVNQETLLKNQIK